MDGIAGSGKTYTALTILSAMTSGEVAVIDSEKAIAPYATLFPRARTFDFEPPFQTKRLVELIGMAEDNGFECLLVDSLSAYWQGPGGQLSQASSSNDSFSAWNRLGEEWTYLLERMRQSPMHIIATAWAKPDYVRNGKKIERKAERTMIRRETEHLFDIHARMQDGNMTILKSRAPDHFPSGQTINHPDAKVAVSLMAWLKGESHFRATADDRKRATLVVEQQQEAEEQAPQTTTPETTPEALIEVDATMIVVDKTPPNTDHATEIEKNELREHCKTHKLGKTDVEAVFRQIRPDLDATSMTSDDIDKAWAIINEQYANA
jgi:hypothetical protein